MQYTNLGIVIEPNARLYYKKFVYDMEKEIFTQIVDVEPLKEEEVRELLID